MLPLLSLLSRRICGHGKVNAATTYLLRSGAAPSFASLANRNIVGNSNSNNPTWLESSRALSSSSSSDAESKLKVAFVGLGNMGLRMALNLARPRSGVDEAPMPPMHLTVYDLHQANITAFFNHAEKMEEIVNSSATILSAASDLVSLGESNPDFVITSLPTCAASEAVVGDVVKSLPANITDNSSGGCTFVDTSTISPSISKKLHQLVTSISPHHNYVDAPVSGGVKGASDASLTFMVGCSSTETFSTIQSLLHRMGKRMIPCGGSGSGSAVKLCNNAALAAQMVSNSLSISFTIRWLISACTVNSSSVILYSQVGICEAMNLGNALGVDPTVLAGVMNVSTAKCWSSEINNPHPAVAKALGSGASANGYEGGFATALMLKDLNLAVDAGEEEGLALPLAGLTRDLYKLASVHGYGGKDFGVMLDFLRGSSESR